MISPSDYPKANSQWEWKCCTFTKRKLLNIEFPFPFLLLSRWVAHCNYVGFSNFVLSMFSGILITRRRPRPACEYAKSVQAIKMKIKVL